MKAISMTRVQSYFPNQLLDELRLIAQEQKVSLAEVIRASARVFVGKFSKKDVSKDGAATVLKSASRLNFSGPKNLSSQIDQYLYGQSD